MKGHTSLRRASAAASAHCPTTPEQGRGKGAAIRCSEFDVRCSAFAPDSSANIEHRTSNTERRTALSHAAPRSIGRGSASAPGFTLLELILATAMMSVLAVTLYQCLRIAYKARDTANAAVGPARSAEIAVGMIRRELENALPPKGVLAGPFIGEIGVESPDASGVQFYAIGQTPREYRPAGGSGTVSRGAGSPRSKGRSGTSGGRSGTATTWGGSGGGDPTLYGGVQRVELVVTPSADGAGGSNLVRRVTRNLLATTEEIPDDEVLCRNVTEFTIRYFDGYQWLDAWDSTQLGDTLPMAVEVALAVDPPPGSPAARAAAANPVPGNVPAYRASRIFFLPCRDETALMQGATQ